MSRAGAVAGSGRGFSVSHQKVVLELSFTGSVVLAGYTELTIIPTDKNLKTVFLNSRQCNIASVSCAGQSAAFSLHDTLSNVTLSDPRDVHLFPELKRKLYAAANEGQGGELIISLPERVLPEASSSQAPTPAAVDAPTPGGTVASSELAPITIRIDYSLADPVDAIQCIRSNPGAPWKQSHLYVSPTCPDFARCWVPCVDSLWERNTWELDFIVPSTLADESTGAEGQESSAAAASQEVVVVCTGDLMGKARHPHSSSKLIYSFQQAAPTSCHHIAFAAGPFVPLDLNADSQTAKTAAEATDPLLASDEAPEIIPLLAFCLPGREQELRCSTAVARTAMDYFSREFGSYPFGSYKMVFVEETVTEVHSASTMTLLSSDLLHPPSVIDQALETRQITAHALAFQWVGINIIQKTWADTWLINGLSLYITGLFWRRLMGNNEYRFRLRKDCDRVCAWDVGMPPLGQRGSSEPPSAQQLPFINLKAPLVLHILDRRLCKAGASLGLGRIIPRVFLQAITGELPNNTLSTSSFLRTCRKVSGLDLRLFADQWIFGSGCPRFFVSSHFNRKKLLIEIHVRQESPAYQFAEYRPELAIGSNPVKIFDGQMTIRINEADGRPYEHVLDVKQPHKRYDIPFNTKYKRVRRNTKRFQARQAAAAAAAEGDQDAAEAIGMIDLGFSLAMWENEEQRERWKVADWTEADEDIMSQAAYEWIRMDSDFEWIATLHVEQPDYMWVSQLQRDRDVVAQLQAVQALAQMPNAISSSMLTRTVLVNKYFFRIRTEAAQAIVNCAIPQLNYLGLFHLLMLFRTSFCIDVPDDASADPLDLACIPRPNDFSEPAEYFVKRALIEAISRVRNERGRTLPQIKRFLINLLRYNDNSTNRFVDDFYVATLISTLADAFTPLESPTFGGFIPANEDPDAKDDEVLLQYAHAEVVRLQELDKLVPSYHNIVSNVALDWQACMVLCGQLPLDLNSFLAYTQQGTFTPLRIAAFNHLLLLSGLKHRIVARYLFAVLRSDESRLVKCTLAKAICESLAIAIATSESPTYVEESSDPAVIDRARDKEMENTLRSLRKEVGRSAGVREGYLGALLATDVDSETRWGLIKLAELLFKPAEEKSLPEQARSSLKIKLPVAPVVPVEMPREAAEVSSSIGLPKIKLTPRPSFDGSRGIDAVPAARVAFDEPAAAMGEEQGKRPPLKLKKPKPVPQAQAAGMSSHDVTACRKTLERLNRASYKANLFINPVDPVRDGAPDYHKVIKEPMDLSTMSNKLEAGLYPDRGAFERDFHLLIKNAKTYTPDPNAWVHKEAEKLRRTFEDLWARTVKTLEQAANQRATAAMQATPTESFASSSSSGAMAPPPVPARASSIKVNLPAPPPAAATVGSPQPQTSKPLGVKLKLKPKGTPSVPPTPASERSSPSASSPLSIPKPTSKAKSPVQTFTPAAVAPAVEAAASMEDEDDGIDTVAQGEGEPIHTKQCKTLLQNLKRLPEAFLFLNPVLEVYAPGYFDVVKSPMDLGTIETKLNSGQYTTMDQFATDVEQIFVNAYLYADITAVQYAIVLRRSFRQVEWPKALIRKLDYQEKRSLQGMLSRIKSHPLGGLFAQSIEEIVKVLPHYHSIIPKEEARDLNMILDRLKADRYGRVEDVDGEMKLMMSNARKFNAVNLEVLALVDQFEGMYKKEWKALMNTLPGSGSGGSGNGKKRMGEDGKGEGASKKHKP